MEMEIDEIDWEGGGGRQSKQTLNIFFIDTKISGPKYYISKIAKTKNYILAKG